MRPDGGRQTVEDGNHPSSVVRRRSSDRITMPRESFDEIAVRLIHYANRAAEAVEAGRVIAARGQAGLGVETWLDELERAARAAGEIQRMFRDLAPYEEAVRAFVATLGRGANE